jgi:hypothetical protein
MHIAAQHDSTFGPKVLGFIRPIAATFEVDLGVVLDVADIRIPDWPQISGTVQSGAPSRDSSVFEALHSRRPARPSALTNGFLRVATYLAI